MVVTTRDPRVGSADGTHRAAPAARWVLSRLDRCGYTQLMDRCRQAIKIGPTLSTRCMLPVVHPEQSHVGKGLAQFDYQRIEWFPGDRREFVTDREDDAAWED